MALVTVLSRFAHGWPKHPVPLQRADAAIAVGPLGEALMKEWDWDAHFVAYVVAEASIPLMGGVRRRLGTAALDHPGIAVEMTHAVFEADDVEAHRTGTPACDAWRGDFAARCAAIEAEHPGQYGYMTRGGGRFAYELAPPLVLRCPEDAQNWKRQYSTVLAYFARRFGLVLDKSCADFTRFFRLPFVTRDGEKQSWPSWGNANNIGKLVLRAEQCDVDAARELLPTAFRAPQIARRFRPHHGTANGTGRGLLYHLLLARRLIVQEYEDGSWAITCPNVAEHSTDTDGTRLYPPTPGNEIGAIHCYHDHCAGRSVGQWLAFFTDDEKEGARNAAGIKPALDIAELLRAAAAKRRAP